MSRVCLVQGLSCPGFVLSRVCLVQGLSCQGFTVSKICCVQSLSCPGFAMPRGCRVQGLLCPGFVMSRVCRVLGLSCPGFSVSKLCCVQSPHRRTPKLRVRPGNRGCAPRNCYINWGGLVWVSWFRSRFRRPAMWAQGWSVQGFQHNKKFLS
jgi:hypothetical protein